jgi:hypothetical protein
MHLHISGIQGFLVALYVIAIIGTMNLLAMKFMDRSKFWASWANLFGLI